MTKLSTSQEAMQEIIEELRQKTLEPAQEEAREIRREAEKEAAHIRNAAEKEAKERLEETERMIQQQKTIFESSLSQAAKQSIESVKQILLKHLFSNELTEVLQKKMGQADLIEKILNALIQAVEKEGIHADLKAVIPKTAAPEEINALLGKHTLERLKDQRLFLGEFHGGAELIAEKHFLRLVMDDQAVKELFAQYLQKDFRKWIFQE